MTNKKKFYFVRVHPRTQTRTKAMQLRDALLKLGYQAFLKDEPKECTLQ